jgi:hypothetical protein
MDLAIRLATPILGVPAYDFRREKHPNISTAKAQIAEQPFEVTEETIA